MTRLSKRARRVLKRLEKGFTLIPKRRADKRGMVELHRKGLAELTYVNDSFGWHHVEGWGCIINEAGLREKAALVGGEG